MRRNKHVITTLKWLNLNIVSVRLSKEASHDIRQTYYRLHMGKERRRVELICLQLITWPIDLAKNCLKSRLRWGDYYIKQAFFVHLKKKKNSTKKVNLIFPWKVFLFHFICIWKIWYCNLLTTLKCFKRKSNVSKRWNVVRFVQNEQTTEENKLFSLDICVCIV